jgi:hypothetical protein
VGFGEKGVRDLYEKMFGRDFHDDIRRETQERRRRAKEEHERAVVASRRRRQWLVAALVLSIGVALAWDMHERHAAVVQRPDLSALKPSKLQRILRLGKDKSSSSGPRGASRGAWDRSELEGAAQAALTEERVNKAGLAGVPQSALLRGARSLLREQWWLTPFACYFVGVVLIPGLLVWCCLWRGSSQERVEAQDAQEAQDAVAAAQMAFAELKPNALCLCGSGLKFKRCCSETRRRRPTEPPSTEKYHLAVCVYS